MAGFPHVKNMNLRIKLLNLFEKLFQKKNIALISFYYPLTRGKGYSLMKIIQEETKVYTTKPHEMYLIYECVRRLSKIKGDIAEVGVYRGTTAKVICEAKKNKTLHLFDTFEGLPTPEKIDDQFHHGQYSASLEHVMNFLKKYKRVKYYKGVFPKETCKSVSDIQFCFVHLDLDLYKGTKESLEFFYQRMKSGGIIISHDYHLPGIKKAFDEFFKNKQEVVIEMPGIQCLVVKI